VGYFSKLDIPECQALFRQGTVAAVNLLARTLDVTIGGMLKEDIPVHYHCDDEWKNHAHAHSADELDQMMTAFGQGDEVLVMCNNNGQPLYVTGFIENPKKCFGTFIFPVLERLTYDGFFDPDDISHSMDIWEGRFDYYIPDGGKGAPPTEQIYLNQLAISFAGAFAEGYPNELYINNILMPGFEWNAGDHWVLTGAPETFKCVAHPMVMPTITINNGNYNENYVIYLPWGGVLKEWSDTLPPEIVPIDTYTLGMTLPDFTKNIWSNLHEIAYNVHPNHEDVGLVGLGWINKKIERPWKQLVSVTAWKDTSKPPAEWGTVFFAWESQQFDNMPVGPLIGASIYPPGCGIGYNPDLGMIEVSCTYDWSWVYPANAVLGLKFRVRGAEDLESLFDKYGFTKPDDEDIFFDPSGLPERHRTWH
jgi:hypothetical protein